MGTERLLTLSQTAKLLGVSARQVRYYVRDGKLQARYPQSGTFPHAGFFFDPDEVEALAELKGRKHTFGELIDRAERAELRVSLLEKRLTVLEQLLGVVEPLRLEDQELLQFYAQARAELEHPQLTAENLTRWAKRFLAFGEEHIERLEALTGDEESWKLFFDLARALSQAGGEPTTALARSYLEVGRRNLRNAAFFHLSHRLGKRKALLAVRPTEDEVDELIALTRVLSPDT